MNQRHLTDKQREYIHKALRFLHYDPEQVIDVLSYQSAAQVIEELKVRSDHLFDVQQGRAKDPYKEFLRTGKVQDA